MSNLIDINKTLHAQCCSCAKMSQLLAERQNTLNLFLYNYISWHLLWRKPSFFWLPCWGTTQYTKHLYRNLRRLQVYLQILNHPILKKNPLLTGQVKQSNNESNLVRNHWVLRNTSVSSEHIGLKSALGKCSFFWTIMRCMLALIFSINWSDKLTIPFCPTSESNQTDPSPSWLVSLQVLISK